MQPQIKDISDQIVGTTDYQLCPAKKHDVKRVISWHLGFLAQFSLATASTCTS